MPVHAAALSGAPSEGFLLLPLLLSSPMSLSTLPRPMLRPAALAVATLAALCGQAFAAETTALDTVIITGSTSERRLVEAPYAISSVSADELRASGPLVNLSEALARVPGINVANRNNYAQDLQISSRGFGARASFGVRGLRLYTDGIPATGPDGQGQLGHADLAGAERVEVLRGPFSVLYGNSSGGVIAVFSKPVREPQFELAADAGSFGLRQLRAGLATPLGDSGFDVSVNVSDMSIDGFRPQSSAERQLATVKLGWKGEQDRVTTIFSHQRQRADDPLGLNAAQFANDPDSTTPQATQFNTRKTIDQDQLGLSWQHRFRDAGALAQSQLSVYSGQRAVVQYLAIDPTVQNNPTNPALTARHGGGVVDFDRSYAGTDARLQWRWDEVSLITGLNVEYQRDDRRGYNNYTGTPTAPTALGVQGDPRRDEINRAVSRDAYTQAEWNLAPDWMLSAGLRSGSVALSTDDHFTSNGNDSSSLRYSYTNPVLGLRWKVEPRLTLHVSAARGHEAPTLGDLAYQANAASGGFNTSLQAQTSRQLELGAKWRETGLALDATLFHIDTDNEIGVATNRGGRSSFRNIGRTERYGAELGANWQIAPGWRSQAALTLLHAAYVDSFVTCTGAPPCDTNTGLNTATVAAGNRVAGTQGASAYAELAWTPFWSSNAETAVEWRAAGRTMANDLNTGIAHGYGLANLRYLQRFPLDERGALELLARIDNITDRRYAGSVIVNDGNARYFEPAAPRSGLVSLRYLRRW